MEPKLYCVKIPSSDFPLHVPVEWLVKALVLCSMLLQVFLVFGGGYRYRSSNGVLRLVVWLAYMSADVVAISALSIMTHTVQSQIYGVWAPLLLLHLGGPDTITAYSTADNELWIRHGLLLIYQVSVAAYVVYLSSLQGYMLATAVLLFIAGANKYGERTVALAYASYSQIVKSTQPVYKFMQYEDEIDNERKKVDYNYLVTGEEQFQRNLKEKQQQLYSRPQENTTQQTRRNWNCLSKERDGERIRYESWNSLLKSGEIVTIKNVLYQEGLQITDKYILCLSHALFKMYKRRFVSLYFHEGVRLKTRLFFIKDRLSPKDLFKIVERELKFMYDVLFSKSTGTAFGKRGTLMRLLNTSLLAVAGVLLYTGANLKPAQKVVTYVVISVAIAVEVIQLCRIAVSDWTMVLLICAYIKNLRRPSRCCWFMFYFVKLAISVLGSARKACGNKYWKESITQYSVMDTSGKWSCIWHWSQSIPIFADLFVPFLIKAFHMKEKHVEPDLKCFIFENLKAACSPDQQIAACRERVYGYDDYLVSIGCENLQWASELEMEDLILTWHIATTICERHEYCPDGTPSSGATAAPPGSGSVGASALSSPGAAPAVRAPVSPAHGSTEDNKFIGFSGMLSRYCAYLIVSHPNLLPLHADIAKMAYIELHHELVLLLKKGQHEWDWKKHPDNKTILGNGTKLAGQLLEKPHAKRWEILSGYWAALLIYMAVYNKAALHAECLACGGEFLSQVWVLVGHMGCGEQSDTAVTKKKEAKTKEEKEEEEKKRREDEENKKKKEEEEEKKRRKEEAERKRREEEALKATDKERRREEGKNAKKQERFKARKDEEQKTKRDEEKKQIPKSIFG